MKCAGTSGMATSSLNTPTDRINMGVKVHAVLFKCLQVLLLQREGVYNGTRYYVSSEQILKVRPLHFLNGQSLGTDRS